MFGNHRADTRQPAIIRLWPSLVCLLAVAAPALGQDTAPGAACVSCVVLHVPASDAMRIDVPPGALEGVAIVVDAGDALAAAALERAAAAGALPGIVAHASAAATPPAPVRLLVLRGVGDDDESVFAVRTMVSAVRGDGPEVRVLLDAPSIPGRVRAYVDGRVEAAAPMLRPSSQALVQASLAGGADPVLIPLRDVDWSEVAAFAADRALSTEVIAAADLSVDAIVARHQAQRHRQDAVVRRTIARGTTSLLFEVPGFVAPITVTAATVIYRQPDLVEIEQRDIRVNGAAISGGSASSPPQLPLIEPERVATPPLAITLDDAYRYALEGRERVAGGEAYVVRFEPHDGRAAGEARGRAWIDARTFALRRLETVQPDLRGAIVFSEQHEVFAPFRAGADTVWLPVRVNVYQRYEGAGHRTPIHRTIETPEYDVNPQDFEARLAAAHASPHLMLRETPQGLRYLLREPGNSEVAARSVAPRAGERVRTAVLGVLIDPNISVPLPFAGLSYVDLNLFGTGTQLNAFFGGTYGQLSWSAPSVLGTRWQAHARAFAIAASYNDRWFSGGIEQYRENITQRPAHASAGLTRPLAWRTRVRLDYELSYTAFDRSDTTAPTFEVPPDALVHGFMGVLERESGPWMVQAWWNPAIRQRWRPWGAEGARGEGRGAGLTGEEGFADARTFQRYGIGVARTLALRGPVSSRVEATWMDGRDLDRFSRYTFGAFENRLRGYPTASIRYDRGGVVRTVTSWAGRGFRLDGFADVAAVRDPGFGQRLRGYPGLGAAVEAGGPFRTLWSVEWGYGFQARRSNGRLGTQAVRITAYRTF
jgi:hypothetical protein